ncbi:MAG: nucleoside phosphorylase [Deltaproteobacteria bacterium]|nr:nucleoside phosphorylase [Deltaproteobacteria bacterium]
MVTPKEMVKNLTHRWIGEEALQVEACALITVIPHDLRALTKTLRGKLLKPWKGYREVYRGYLGEERVTLALSPFGASNAVALAEELASFGMQKALFLGYCGSLQQRVRVGDIVIPTEAIREEGASFHYLPPGVTSQPHQEIQAIIVDILQKNKVPYHQGKIWTTDAIYRETRGKVGRYQEEGVLGVEMELSALFAFGMAQGIKVGGLLVVSDELFGGNWHPRFFSPKLIRGVKKARKMAVETLRGML